MTKATKTFSRMSGWLKPACRFVRRNRHDLWTLTVPVLFVTTIGLSSIGTGAGFLLIWAAARQVGRLATHV
ncbi:MAG: hypothetical protein KJ731_15790 [Alphaproteobacteria bacterium]|nr:hypothetical protein [Alphaproteobacteria bacterium]MBU1277645.1 hypothetical protein [Alphaproteobacteria bacterium]MBU1574514.1 hypothetical protein [Alphaproteobacteria bacterium]MBU1829913.1 hypothetical protein [Alphaproteobacteria bacterium]MBU2079951.1 hypothetical protein [Alphaproteobacteria bacterium]